MEKETVLEKIFEACNRGRTDEALTTALQAGRESPGDADVLSATGAVYELKNDYVRALECYLLSVEADAGNTVSHFKVSDMIYVVMQQNPQLAMEYLGRWEKAAPEHAIPQVMGRTLRGQEAEYGADYVRMLFDDFAPSFDIVLAKLHYATPAMIGRRLARLLRAPADIIDLGCGTGLCAEALRPFALRLDGVDVSPKMLEVARERSLYNRLYCQDITELEVEGRFDVAAAGDVFTYMKDIGPALCSIKNIMKPGGYVLFSITTVPWYKFRDAVQRQNARYDHALRHVKKAARRCGLKVVSVDRFIPRKELGRDVKGALVTLRVP